MQIMEATDINFEVYEMGNKPTNEAQRVDVKNGVICLFFMFTIRVVVIKMSKMAHFLYFPVMTTKSQSQLGQNI